MDRVVAHQHHMLSSKCSTPCSFPKEVLQGIGVKSSRKEMAHSHAHLFLVPKDKKIIYTSAIICVDYYLRIYMSSVLLLFEIS